MRVYHFGNMYLSSIQQAIQGGHARDELWIRYVRGQLSHEKTAILFEWADNHKVQIFLNGGYSEQLRNLIQLFVDTEYPMAYFEESTEALDGALTSVCVVLPEKIYCIRELKREIRFEPDWLTTKAANKSFVRQYEAKYGKLTEKDFDIARELLKYPLAH